MQYAYCVGEERFHFYVARQGHAKYEGIATFAERSRGGTKQRRGMRLATSKAWSHTIARDMKTASIGETDQWALECGLCVRWYSENELYNKSTIETALGWVIDWDKVLDIL